MTSKNTSDLYIVDSCGWIEYIEDRPQAGIIESFILDTRHLLVPTVSFYEVYKYIKREYGSDAAFQVGFEMKQSRIIPLDQVLALQAADLSLEYSIPMADAIILAVARAYRATIHTFDSHLDGIPSAIFYRK